jgi:hypothetical protein
MQRTIAGGEGGYQETQAQKKKRNGISYKVTQECPRHSDIATVCATNS